MFLALTNVDTDKQAHTLVDVDSVLFYYMAQKKSSIQYQTKYSFYYKVLSMNYIFLARIMLATFFVLRLRDKGNLKR